MSRLLLLALAGAACLALTSSASAQVPHDDFSSMRFYPAPGPGNFVTVDGARIGADLAPSAGAFVDYAHRPFVADDIECFVDPTGACPETETDLVGGALTLQLAGAITVAEHLQIGLSLPVVLYYYGARVTYLEQGPMGPVPRTIEGGESASLGDPRLHVKLPFLTRGEAGWTLRLAVAAWLSLPLGTLTAPEHWIGDRVPAFSSRLIGQLDVGDLSFALQIGGTIREEAQVFRSAVGPEVLWALAASWRMDPLVSAVLEVVGTTTFGRRFESEAPIELIAAGRVHLGELTAIAGVGVGLVYGVGVPEVRGFLGATWAPAEARDGDRDGVADGADACPSEAEDRDDHEDADGCPEGDDDGDRLDDRVNQCPSEPEDRDEHQDEDGCPDPDDDGDGIGDGWDSCPRTAEDMDGDRDTDGCPEGDADEDGIMDMNDRCPEAAEDTDGLADEDGCPEEDVDGDNIPDVRDRCPEQREDVDRFQDRDGCPEDGGRPIPVESEETEEPAEPSE